jgi:hypothetical protein
LVWLMLLQILRLLLRLCIHDLLIPLARRDEISLLICIINKAVKDFVATTGANVCLEVIIQCGKSLNNVQDTLYRFDGAPPSCFIFNTFESM